MALEFQVVSWFAEDVEDDEFGGLETESSESLQYTITMFGRTIDNKSVSLQTPFTPFFYIGIHDHWKSFQQMNFVEELKKKVPKDYRDHLIRHSQVTRKKFYGYTNNKDYKFILLVFKSQTAFTKWKYAAMRTSHEIFEANFDPMLRFAHLQDIKMAGWVKVEAGKWEAREEDEQLHEVNIEAIVGTYKNVLPSDREDIAPIVQASFDIEVYSDEGFPDPERPNHACIQIATTLQRFGESEPYKKHLITLKSCDPIDGVELESYEKEKHVLEAWARLMREEDVDTMTGWNIWGFDLNYMGKRAQMTNATFDIGRVKAKPSKLFPASFSSGAYGDSDYLMLSTLGRLQIDLMVIVKREHKLDSYRLDFVAEKFLKERKVDMPIKEMFKKQLGSSKDRREIGVYCVQDTNLPQRLIDKLAILPNMVEMAKATRVPMSFLLERGQGIKVFSQLLFETREAGMLVKTFMKQTAADEKYEGATVLGAKKGAYMDTPITGLDFASLYPTIIRAHNLCPNTLLMNDNFDNTKENWTIVEIQEDPEKPPVKYKYAQNTQGIIPKMLEKLALNRKAAKKEMGNAKKEGNMFMYQVYNGKQLAFKVSMNSIYGFLGATKGMLPCKPVAAATTKIGREMIEQTKNLVEEWYPGADVVYGDSVTGDTPLLINSNGTVKTCRIDSLVPFYEIRDDGKEVGQINAMVWTESGFTQIENVIRHKTTKKIYRILTHTGIVDVTEDHSLLNQIGEILKPTEVSIGTRLMHAPVEITCFETEVSISEAKVMGFFFGDGSCGRYGEKSKVKYTWALNNANIDYLIEMQQLAPFETSLIDTIDSSGVYKLTAIGNPKDVVTRYRSMFYNCQKEKIVPSCILNGSQEIIKSFWDGYYMADGDKDLNKYTRCDCKGKEGTMGLFILAQRMGYNVSINCRNDKESIFRITLTQNNQRKDPLAIKKIECLGEITDYVYDLTTSNHHFHIGPGNMVVHNTDSVMVKFKTEKTGRDAIEECFKFGEEAADKISATFKKPIELEFEKVYYPYLLFSKKRYAGLMYTSPEKPDYIDAKGIQLVRRDNCPLVRDISTKVLNTIMYDLDVNQAMEHARNAARDLLYGKVPVEKLVVSKSIRRIKYEEKDGEIQAIHDYKSSAQPHITLALKLERREPGTGPRSGDRIPYVFVKTGNPKDLQYLKAEDPNYVKEHGLPLDAEYYLEHSLNSPLESLFELFMVNPSKELFERVKREYYGSQQINMKEWFEDQIRKRLKLNSA